MRCPECQHVQKYNRSGMSCARCRYAYVFDPKKDRLSDFALRRMIDQLSDNAQYWFTRNQLAIEISRYLTNRLLMKKLAGRFLFGFAITLVGTAVVIPASWWVVAFIVSAGLWAILFFKTRYYWLSRIKLPVQLPWHDALEIIDRYQSKHPIERLASGRAFRISPDNGTIDDLYFAPDAILLVPRHDLVDMLVRNRFPQQHKTLVLSHDGYPKHIFEACRVFLENHPKLPVHIIHDASEQDFDGLRRLVNDSRWQNARDHISDLGWSRQHIIEQKVRLPWIREGHITFSLQHRQQLQQGARVPLDFPPPAAMTTLLAAAVTSGVMLALAAESISGWSLAFEYSEDYG